MVILFVFVALSVLVLGFTLTGWRLISTSELPTRWRRAAWLAVGFCFLLPPCALLAQFLTGGPVLGRLLGWAGYLSLAYFNMLFFLLLGRDLLSVILRGLERLRTVRPELTANEEAGGLEKGEAPSDPDRRIFLARAMNLGMLGTAASVVGYGIFEAHRTPAAHRVSVVLPGLAREFDGFRIAQISDLHVGLTIGRNFVSTVVDTVQALAPDLIAVTGDLVDGSVSVLARDVEPLKGLSAPYGVYFVTGNHEYYSGVGSWLEEVSRLGMTPLINEHRVLRKDGASLVLAGVPDFRAERLMPSHRHDPVAAYRGTPEGVVRILLAHQPQSIYAAEAAGTDLMLAGHTHGGQYLPWTEVSGLFNPYVSGLHRHGRTQIYVTNGTGYWGPPIRLAARSEIALVELKVHPKEDRC